MKYSKLLAPYALKNLPLTNRIVMAPMTRSRASQSGVPNELMADYYAQRSSVGLIISEACQISLQAQGYAKTPGIYTQEQIEGWKLVTRAVHQKGGKIFLQLWHVGRVSSALVNGLEPIGPSAIPAKGTQVYVFGENNQGDAVFVPVDPPREMSLAEIEQTVQDFVQAAQNALAAGFDGVEIHAANGYLIDQFLRSNSNVRTDLYGGSKENRIRFLSEVSRAVVDAIGSERVGVRLSPFIKFKDMDCHEILQTIQLAAVELSQLDLAYLHLCEADWEDAPQIPLQFRRELRNNFKNALIATGNKNPAQGEELIQSGLVDLIGFGRPLISNPDYVERILRDFPLAPIGDRHKLFGGGTAVGYSDYPMIYKD